jgi:hypothetical protein
MRFDRAAAGLTFAGILVGVSLSPDGERWMTYPPLALAALIAIVAFAPLLPILNTVPKIGAPQLSVYISSESVSGVKDAVVLRIGFENVGPRRVEGTLVNVLVPASLTIHASDHKGKLRSRGSDGPETVHNGERAQFWAERDVALPVGSSLFHYRIHAPEPGEYWVHVSFSSDDLYGGADRVEDGILVI